MRPLPTKTQSPIHPDDPVHPLLALLQMGKLLSRQLLVFEIS